LCLFLLLREVLPAACCALRQQMWPDDAALSCYHRTDHTVEAFCRRLCAAACAVMIAELGADCDYFLFVNECMCVHVALPVDAWRFKPQSSNFAAVNRWHASCSSCTGA
jgi:hypothetical protein